MRSRPVFTKRLSGVKFLHCAVIMVVSQHAREDVDDTWIAAMAVQANMTAVFNDSAAKAEFSALHALDLFADVNRREDVFGDPLVICRCALLAEYHAGRKEQQRH